MLPRPARLSTAAGFLRTTIASGSRGTCLGRAVRHRVTALASPLHRSGPAVAGDGRSCCWGSLGAFRPAGQRRVAGVYPARRVYLKGLQQLSARRCLAHRRAVDRDFCCCRWRCHAFIGLEAGYLLKLLPAAWSVRLDGQAGCWGRSGLVVLHTQRAGRRWPLVGRGCAGCLPCFYQGVARWLRWRRTGCFAILWCGKVRVTCWNRCFESFDLGAAADRHRRWAWVSAWMGYGILAVPVSRWAAPAQQSGGASATGCRHYPGFRVLAPSAS